MHLSAFVEVVRLTFRQLLGRRRTILLVLLAALPPLLALLFRAANELNILNFTQNAYDPVSLSVVLPLTAVLFGTGAFGAEIDEGTILYLLAKPIPRWLVLAAKIVAALLVALLITVLSVLAAGLILLVPAGSAGGPATQAYVASMVVGCLCYTMLFVALSLFTRRALLIGVGYALVWEGALSSLLPGIANLSVRQYSLGIADAFYRLHGSPAALSPTTALTLSAALVVIAFLLATYKLMRFELPGGTD